MVVLKFRLCLTPALKLELMLGKLGQTYVNKLYFMLDFYI